MDQPAEQKRKPDGNSKPADHPFFLLGLGLGRVLLHKIK